MLPMSDLSNDLLGDESPEELGDFPPYQRHSKTSLDAADSVKEKTPALRKRIRQWLREHGPATDEEIIDAFGGPTHASSIRPRRVELVQLGSVFDTNVTKKTRSGRSAVLWEATVMLEKRE